MKAVAAMPLLVATILALIAPCMSMINSVGNRLEYYACPNEEPLTEDDFKFFGDENDGPLPNDKRIICVPTRFASTVQRNTTCKTGGGSQTSNSQNGPQQLATGQNPSAGGLQQVAIGPKLAVGENTFKSPTTNGISPANFQVSTPGPQNFASGGLPPDAGVATNKMNTTRLKPTTAGKGFSNTKRRTYLDELNKVTTTIGHDSRLMPPPPPAAVPSQFTFDGYGGISSLPGSSSSGFNFPKSSTSSNSFANFSSPSQPFATKSLLSFPWFTDNDPQKDTLEGLVGHKPNNLGWFVIWCEDNTMSIN